MRSRSVVLPATASVLSVPTIEGTSAVSAHALSHVPGGSDGVRLHAEVLHVFGSGFYLGVETPHRSCRFLLPVMGPAALQLPFGVAAPGLGPKQLGPLRPGTSAEVVLHAPAHAAEGRFSPRRLELVGFDVDVVREHRPLRIGAESWPPLNPRLISAAARLLRPGVPELPDLARALASAVLAADGPETTAGVRALLGRGPGSTPSGDDALCGIALALNLTAHSSQLRLLARTLDSVGTGDRTPALSAALIRAAVSGHCVPEVAEAIHASRTMLTARAGSTGSVLSPLNSVGHSSGHDVFTGFLALLSCLSSPPLTKPPHSLTSH